nr:uncharacterized protein CI109_001302 [Kwoniella shandongensis]KAA5530498.1 hypothetical protein CI109_001302 [Kwoniella shandongensis]
MTITRSYDATPTNNTSSSSSSSSSRVAYIWSQDLQDVADDLPSNVGRSSMAHGLIDSLGLLDHTQEPEDGGSDEEDDDDVDGAVEESAGGGDGEDGATTKSKKQDQSSDQIDQTELRNTIDDSPSLLRTAKVIAPDLSLGTKTCLLRYHDKAYVGVLSRPPSAFWEIVDLTPASIVERLLRSHTDDTPDDPTQPPSPTSSTPPSSPEVRPRKMARTDPYNLSHDNPVFSTLPKYISLIAAATSTACRLLAQNKADWTIVWDGGRHHAKRAEAGGFCYVNDLVLGMLSLTREGRMELGSTTGPVPVSSQGENGNDGKHTEGTNGENVGKATRAKAKPKTRPPRIMYLDLDLHYSDGVSLAFHSPTKYPHPLPTTSAPPKPPNVLTLSVHHSSPIFFPPPTPPSLLPSPNTTSPFSLSIPLAAYPSNTTYQTIFEGCIEPIAKAWKPDYVVLQLGTDGLPGDRVGQYGNWGVEGVGGMKWVVEKVRRWQGVKVCVTGGGGYRHENAARAWAAVTSVLLDRELDGETPIPHHDHFEEYAPSFTMEVPEGMFMA